ncbi:MULTISPECIES: RagB/SusD family nutrient uptake outer membrane protein [Niastella]|uniref:RagB/SusD family nutrient uptake outer membrane protein n=1 Tax=Niastella soli TaxID=2821487 RepID=A0ABS3Z3A5_9BACT|nr:RagB/SusD family nutrient uptake outer membrane protein [Niastella soli]MBO9204620.1 RagB/SusD family nutrient uptake outer membrane protein [Niastella soli]
MKSSYQGVLFILIVLMGASCEKFVEVQAPSTSLTALNTYSNDATAASVLTGVYSYMGDGGVCTGGAGISLSSGLSADELTLSAGAFFGRNQQLYQNNLSSMVDLSPSYWQDYYKTLLTVNSAIEGLTASSSLTPAVRMQLLGEAYFLRAFFHFYLVNFYGKVPLMISSDWRVNAVTARMPIGDVYQQIIYDLKNAEELLSDKYVMANALTIYPAGSEERVRPNKWAAAALLARVYLYYGNLTGDANNYASAEAQATSIINNNALFGLSTLDQVFKKNNLEAIWQIQYVNPDYNTEAFHFILTDEPNFTCPTYISDFLMNAFEPGDRRKTEWIKGFTGSTTTYYYPFKYQQKTDPNNSEYLMVFRLAEQYLIRAEVKAKQNKIAEAITDLDKLRDRAELPLLAVTDPGITQAALLDTILHERQVELFTEWGHRWFDLKRTGEIDGVMSTVLPTKRPGFIWNTNWQLYPLFQGEIKLNPNLHPNNPGY